MVCIILAYCVFIYSNWKTESPCLSSNTTEIRHYPKNTIDSQYDLHNHIPNEIRTATTCTLLKKNSLEYYLKDQALYKISKWTFFRCHLVPQSSGIPQLVSEIF